MIRTPTGFVAKCQCGATVAALDALRTPHSAKVTYLLSWLADGWTVEPRFSGTWSAQVEPCRCDPLRGAGEVTQ